MIIKIIPETEFEKARLQTVTHTQIGEFFIFGSKKDGDGDVIDFHDWSGSYMGLIGKIHYYELQLIEEQRNKNKESDPSKIIPMIKRSTPQDGKIVGTIGENEIKEIMANNMENIEENNGGSPEATIAFPVPLKDENEETDRPTENN